MLDVVKRPDLASAVPFDAARLDRLMDEAGIDVLFATSKHNVQYLLGGHRAFFFDYMDAMGLSPLSPGLGLSQGRARQGGLFRPPAGELPARERCRSGRPVQQCNSSGSVDTMQKADRVRPQASASDKRHRRRACVPADRCGHRAARRVPRREIKDATVRARADARNQDAGGTGEAADRFGARHRVDAGGDRQARSRQHQGGIDRSAAARGNDPRPDLRILPDHRWHQPQPRTVRPGLGRGRHPVARFRRQLSRLYRRPLPHGDPGRAGRRARAISWPRSRKSSAPR